MESFHLRSSDASLPKDLPKIHKKNVPFRIIMSSINTALYLLAKFLKSIISKNILKAKGFINKNIKLYNKVLNVILDGCNVLVSLDVTSLFNVPLDLAMVSIEKR